MRFIVGTVVFVVVILALINEVRNIHNETATLFIKLDQLSESLNRVVEKQEQLENKLKRLDNETGALSRKAADLEDRFMGTIEVYQTDLHELHTELDTLQHSAPKKSTKRKCKCR